MKLAHNILHKLLDSHERGVSRISVPISKNHEYKVSAEWQETNNMFKKWELQGWVSLKWVRHEEDNLLEKVTLQIEAVSEIYTYLGRKPKSTSQLELVNLITDYINQLREQSPFRMVLAEQSAQLTNGKSSQPFDINKYSDNIDLLKAIVGLDWLENDELERKFSARVLEDSKRFSKLKNSLQILIKQAYPELAESKDHELWEAMQIVSNPSHIYLHGKLQFYLNGTQIDTSVFSPDIGLSMEAISYLKIVGLDAPYLLTIENLTSFYDYVKAFPYEGLILYLGGFPNHARRQFLKCLVEFNPTLPFYHWGDMDYGGFQILAYLRREIQTQIRPLQMDRVTLEQYYHNSQPLDDLASRNRLVLLKQNDSIRDLHEVIEKMLTDNIKRIEQENLTPVSPIFHP